MAATVLATFWDVWHSGLQTFGLARIYERNQGNPPTAARRLDFWLSHLLYAGPILAGATMLDHFHGFEAFGEVGMPWLASVPARMTATHRAWTLGVLGGGGAFLLFYVAASVRLVRRGHRLSFHKVFLLVTTGACSIYTWGFNSWGEAFFIMNLLHAVQYLALVWAMEGERLRERLRPRGRRVALALFLGSVLAYGVGAELLNPDLELPGASVSALHVSPKSVERARATWPPSYQARSIRPFRWRGRPPRPRRSPSCRTRAGGFQVYGRAATGAACVSGSGEA